MQTFISDLKQQLSSWTPQAQISDYGIVTSVFDGIVRIAGLPNVSMSETLLIETDTGNVSALVQNLEQDSIGAVMFGIASSVREGDRVRATGTVFSLPVGADCLGRVLDPFMKPLDGKPAPLAQDQYPVERTAPGVMHRQSVNQPLQTGIKVIDALVPIGRGQRELIIGDRQTGKTTVAIDAILNQKNTGVKCIYVAIGQKQSKVMRIVQDLTVAGAMEYTTIILASASDSASQLYIAPYAGVTLAEYFMDKGQDVLIVYDDLSKHANAYREMSLLLRRPPGREAYPGDVFYLHSRLLERACRRNAEHGGGSITALPIIETQAGDISGYIPTNVISITDGQIFLESSLFNKGVRPAINAGLSVSRVGGSAQIKSMKKIAGPMKLQLAQYRELESFSQFDSDLDPATKSTLERGKRLTELLKQAPAKPMSTGAQVAVLYFASKGYLDAVPVVKVREVEELFVSYLQNSEPEILSAIESGWSEEIEVKLRDAIEVFQSMQQ